MKNSRAFTLIEILVASTLFSFAVLTVTSLFFTLNISHTRTNAIRSTTQETRFFIEEVVREIRLADPEQNSVEVISNPSALPSGAVSAGCLQSAIGGSFQPVLKVKKGGVERYYQRQTDSSSGRLRVAVCVNRSSGWERNFVTSENSEIVNLRFSQVGIFNIPGIEGATILISAQSRPIVGPNPPYVTLRTSAYKRKYTQRR